MTVSVYRIYGQLQTAGVKVDTVAKSQINSAGTDAYAQLVGVVGGDESSPANADNPLPTEGSLIGHTDDFSITRPNDTVAYGALDVIGTGSGTTPGAAAMEFIGVGVEGGGDVFLTGIELQIDVDAIPSGQTSYQVALYNVTPPSAYVDNTTWNLPSGDRAAFLGIFSAGSPVDLGSTCYVRVDGINAMLKTLSTSIFGYLITTTGFTPTASSVRKVTLHTLEAR